MRWLLRLLGIGKEQSPSDWLPKEAITVAANSVTLDMRMLLPKLNEPPKVWIPPVPKYKDPSKGSMLPNFSHEHNNILIAGANEADHQLIIEHLQEGDIAVYRIMQNDNDDPADFSRPDVWYAIHRIIKIDSDEQNRYFRFKGENNPVNDPYKAREKNILWASIGTIF